MKKIFVALLLFVFCCACGSNGKNEIIEFYINSENDYYEYGNLVIKVLQIDGECVYNTSCSKNDKVTLTISAGTELNTQDYVMNLDSEYVEIDIDEEKKYLKLDVVGGQLAIVVYE